MIPAFGALVDAHRPALRALCRRRRRETAYQALGSVDDDPSANFAAREALRKAMDALPDVRRGAFAHCIPGDFSPAEAAFALSLPVGAVTSHVK